MSTDARIRPAKIDPHQVGVGVQPTASGGALVALGVALLMVAAATVRPLLTNAPDEDWAVTSGFAVGLVLLAAHTMRTGLHDLRAPHPPSR